VSGSATFGLSEHFVGQAALIKITVSYRFIEDERVGDHASLDITTPAGFTLLEDGSFQGVLHRDTEVHFVFVSAPYDPAWSGRLIANGEMVASVSSEAVPS
jgi:hypothetical protein